MAIVDLAAIPYVREAVATDRTQAAIATAFVREPVAALRLPIGSRIELYFAEDYMVDNNDYAHTVVPI